MRGRPPIADHRVPRPSPMGRFHGHGSQNECTARPPWQEALRRPRRWGASSKDIQTYERAHRADLAQTSKAETAAKGKKKTAKKATRKTAARSASLAASGRRPPGLAPRRSPMRGRAPLAAALAPLTATPAAPGLAQARKDAQGRARLRQGRGLRGLPGPLQPGRTPPPPRGPGRTRRCIRYVERELEKQGLRRASDAQGRSLRRDTPKATMASRGTHPGPVVPARGKRSSATTGVDFRKVAEELLLELQRATRREGGLARGTGYISIDKKRIDADTASAIRC